MMSERKEGDCAFPFVCSDVSKTQVHEPGMSLRDYFAGMAITNVVTPDDLQNPGVIDAGLPSRCGIIARVAYTFADAMIVERDK